MGIEVKARILIRYIESLSDFQLVGPEIPVPYGHMGATITDAMLQAGTTWETVVKPRVKAVMKNPEGKKTTGFEKLLKKEGPNRLLNWEDQEKPRRLMEVTAFFIKEGIETEEDLKSWIGQDNNIPRLKKLRGIGNKTVDYFKILSGMSTPAVHR